MGPSSHPNNTLSMLGFIWVCVGLPEADSCDTLPAPQLPPPAASPAKCLSVATWIMTWERYGKIRSDRALCAAQSAEDVPVTIENRKEHLRKITRLTRSGRLCHDIEDLLRRNHKSKACQKRYWPSLRIQPWNLPWSQPSIILAVHPRTPGFVLGETWPCETLCSWLGSTSKCPA